MKIKLPTPKKAICFPCLVRDVSTQEILLVIQQLAQTEYQISNLTTNYTYHFSSSWEIIDGEIILENEYK